MRGIDNKTGVESWGPQTEGSWGRGGEELAWVLAPGMHLWLDYWD